MMGATIRFLSILLLLTVSPLWSSKSLAEGGRIALLIGNETYSAQVGTLTNPHNDVEIVGEALKKAGFSVLIKNNLRRAEIMRAVSEYAQRVNGAGSGTIGFFYYSGHGVSRPLDRVNYLIPVDVTSLQDQDFWYNAVSLDAILNELVTTAPKASHLVVFDACRTELRLPTKDAVKGFVPVTDRNGVFIAFSTSPNSSSSDRGEKGGPYARILASELPTRGQDHLSLFQNVKERVYTATGTAQTPWENNGLIQRVYLAGKLPESQANPQPTSTSSSKQAVSSPEEPPPGLDGYLGGYGYGYGFGMPSPRSKRDEPPGALPQ